MVTTNDAPETQSGYLTSCRTRSDQILDLIRRNEPRCDEIKIESGRYIFDSADDLSKNWQLVSDDHLEIRFLIWNPELISSSIKFNRKGVYYHLSRKSTNSQSQVIAEDIYRFIQHSKSWLRRLYFWFLIVLAVVFYIIALLIGADELREGLLSLVFCLASVGLLFGSGIITRKVLPTIYHGSRSQLVQSIILPTLTALIAGLIVMFVQLLVTRK